MMQSTTNTWLIALSLLISSFGSAQIPSLFLLSDDTLLRNANAWVIASGEAGVGSNTLDVEFMRKMTLGGHITSEHIDKLYGRMGGENRLGYHAAAEMTFMNLRDTLFVNPRIGLKATIGTHSHGFIGFTDQMFSTIFSGNRDLAGSNVELGPAHMAQQRWQKFGLGVFDKKTWSGFTLSLVEGQSYQSVQLDEAQFYNSANGDTLRFSPKGEYLRSDTTRSGWANGSGVGVALDADFNLPFADGSGLISIALRDVGFVKWNDATEHYVLSNAIEWNGIDVNPWLVNRDDTLSIPAFEDSLVKSREQHAILAPLPMAFHLRYMKRFGKGHFYEAGWSLWPNRVARPQVYAGITHAFSNRLMVSGRVSVGGYGRWGLGAEVQWLPRGTWLLRAGTQALSGLVIGSSRAANAYVSLAKSF